MLIALNGPTEGEGDEATYNDWYNNIHLPDLLAVEGVKTARRFKVINGNRAPWPYAAVYEIETDDPTGFIDRLYAKIRPFTPTFDRTKSGFVLAEELST
jgi:hypothetical protein